MNSQTFITSNIDILCQQIPYLQVRYEFDSIDNSHYVEILPSSYFKENSAYIAFEKDMLESFISMFPFESLTFLSENSLYEIENPIYVKKGSLYEIICTLEYNDLLLKNRSVDYSALLGRATPIKQSNKPQSVSYNNHSNNYKDNSNKQPNEGYSLAA